MGHRTTNRRKGVVFGAGMLGGIMAFTSLAFACTPIVGLMTITNVDPTSPHLGSKSVTVGMGRGRTAGDDGEAAMDFCEDNLATTAPNDGIVGGATGAQGELITIEVAPMICDENFLLSNVIAYAEKINEQVQAGNPDPRNWPFAFDLELANFLFPDPAAEVNYRNNSFSISGSTYTYAPFQNCMTWDATGVNNSGPPFGTMAIGPGTGSATFPIPDGTILPASEAWAPSAAGTSGGVCVNSVLGGVIGGTAAIAMAPLTVI